MKNKVVLVTGATGGLGEYIAIKFASVGAKVVVHYNTKMSKAESMVRKFRALGSDSMDVYADISYPPDVELMINTVINKYGKIDILINCAGIYIDGISWKLHVDDWNKVISVNLTGSFLTIKHVLPHMRDQEFGRIVNISSIVGQIGVAGTSNYAASKAGLFGLTKSVAKEVAKKNITVNALSLGYFDAGMFVKLHEKVQNRVISQIPIGRAGKMDELLHTLLFLCSDDCSYLTGQVIHLNGGLYM